jgi:predicted amidophosphoribosyltransferase
MTDTLICSYCSMVFYSAEAVACCPHCGELVEGDKVRG